MRKILLIFCLIMAVSYLCSEDLDTSSGMNIILSGETGYGYIKVDWEIQGIEEYEKLELKILNRKETEETIDVSNKKSYVIDRGFTLDDSGSFNEISIWLVASIEKRKKIGVKYYRTGTDYIASNMYTSAPLSYPSPNNPQYSEGKIFCRLILDNQDLINRFSGFEIDGSEYKKSHNPYGTYEIKLKKSGQPAGIAAIFSAYEKPFQAQKSSPVIISKSDINYSDILKPGVNDDKITYISSHRDSSGSADIFDLAVEEKQKPEFISISWNKIQGADHYLIYRHPAEDSLYLVFDAYSLPAVQSQKYNRLRFDNNFFIDEFQQRTKLQSKNVYSYWISAKQVFETLGISSKISVYYYRGVNGSFNQELKKESVKLNIPDTYSKITSNHKGISKSLETMGFENLVSDFSVEADTLSFEFHYIDLMPYRYLESGNDGYLNSDTVIRAFLPKKYATDYDLMALMTIINYHIDPKKKLIANNKILTDGLIKIPIPQEMMAK